MKIVDGMVVDPFDRNIKACLLRQSSELPELNFRASLESMQWVYIANRVCIS